MNNARKNSTDRIFLAFKAIIWRLNVLLAFKDIS